MSAFWRDSAGFTIGVESKNAPVAPPDMMRFRYTGKNAQISFSGQPYKDLALTAQDIPIDGAFPEGMGQELQARGSSTTFKALTYSGASGSNLFLGGAVTIDAASVQDRSIVMGAVIAYPHVKQVFTEYQTTPGPILMQFDRARGVFGGGLNLIDNDPIAEIRFRGQTAGTGTWTNLAYIQTKWKADYGGFIEIGAGSAPATDAAGARLLVTQNLGLGFFTSAGAFPFLVDQTANVRVGLGTLAPTATAGFLWVPQATGLLTTAPAPNHFGWKPLSFVGDEIYTWDGTRWKSITANHFTGEWKFSTLVSGPVGNGYFRVDSTFATATSLVINNETTDAIDCDLIFAALIPGDQIYFQDKDDNTKWARYEITAAGILVDDDWGFMVTPLGANGTIANNQACIVRMIWGGGGGGGGTSGTISPGGAIPELQYKLNATTFGGVGNSAVTGADVKFGGSVTVTDATPTVAASKAWIVNPTSTDLSVLMGQSAETVNPIRFEFQRSRGVAGAPADLVKGDYIGRILFTRKEGASFPHVGYLQALWDGGAAPDLGAVVTLGAGTIDETRIALTQKPGLASINLYCVGGNFFQVQTYGFQFSHGTTGSIYYKESPANGSWFTSLDLVDPADEGKVLTAVRVPAGTGLLFPRWSAAGATGPSLGGANGELLYRVSPTAIGSVTGSVVSTSDISTVGNLSFLKTTTASRNLFFYHTSATPLVHGEHVGEIVFKAVGTPDTQIAMITAFYQTSPATGYCLRMGGGLGYSRIDLADDSTGAVNSATLIAGNGAVTIQAQQSGIFFGTAAATTTGALYYRASTGALAGLQSQPGFLKSTATDAIPAWGTIAAGDLPAVPIAKGGTGRTDATIGDGFLLIGDGTGYALNQLVGAGGITITYPTPGHITLTQAAAVIAAAGDASQLQYRNPSTGNLAALAGSAVDTSHVVLGGNLSFNRVGAYAGGYSVVQFNRENASGANIGHGEVVGTMAFSGRLAAAPAALTQLGYMESYYDTTFGGVLRLGALLGGNTRLVLADNGTLSSVSLVASNGLVTIQAQQGGIYFGTSAATTDGALYYRAAGGALTGLAGSAGFLKWNGSLPAYTAITIADWTGIVPVGQGGTNWNGSPTVGQILRAETTATYKPVNIVGTGSTTVSFTGGQIVVDSPVVSGPTFGGNVGELLYKSGSSALGGVLGSMVSSSDITLVGTQTISRTGAYAGATGVLRFFFENTSGADIASGQQAGRVEFYGKRGAQTQLGYVAGYWSDFGGGLRLAAGDATGSRIDMQDDAIGTHSITLFGGAGGAHKLVVNNLGIDFIGIGGSETPGAIYHQNASGYLGGIQSTAGFLKSTGTNAIPSFQPLTISDWSGVVPVTQAGLGASTSPTVGQILRANTTTTYQPVNIVGTGGTTVAFTAGQIVVDSATTSGGPTLGGANNELVYRSSPTGLLTVTGSIVAPPDISLAGNLTFLKPATTGRTVAFYHTSGTALAHGEHVGDILFKAIGTPDIQVALITAFYQTSPSVGYCLRMGGGVGYSRIDLVDNSTGSVNSVTLVAGNGSFTIQAQQAGIFFGTSAATTTGALYYRASGGALTGLDGGTGFLRTSGSGTVPSWNLVNLSTDTAATALPTAKGGTGRTDATIANGSLLMGNSVGYSLLASSAGFLKSTGVAATLTFSPLTVSDWTGIVPTAQGGLGASGSGTQGQVPRIEASGTAYAPATLVGAGGTLITHDYTLDTITITAPGGSGPTLGGNTNELLYKTGASSIGGVLRSVVSSTGFSLGGNITISRTGTDAGGTGLLKFEFENAGGADIIATNNAGKVEFYGRLGSQTLLSSVAGIYSSFGGMLRLAAGNGTNTYLDLQDNNAGTGGIYLYGGNGTHQLIVNNLGIDLIGTSGTQNQGAIYHQDASGYVGALRSNPGVLQSTATDQLPTWGAVNLASSTYVTGVLPIANVPTITTAKGGTGRTDATVSNGFILIGNGTGYALNQLTGSGGITFTLGTGTIQINQGAGSGGIVYGTSANNQLAFRSTSTSTIDTLSNTSISGSTLTFSGAVIHSAGQLTVSVSSINKLVVDASGYVGIGGSAYVGIDTNVVSRMRIGAGNASRDREVFFDFANSPNDVLMTFNRYTNTNPTLGSTIVFDRGRGTQGGPSNLVADDYIGSLAFRGWRSLSGGLVYYSEVNARFVTNGGQLELKGLTTLTNAPHPVIAWGAASTGTIANGFGAQIKCMLPSSAGTFKDVSAIEGRWQEQSDTTRSGVVSLRTVHKGGAAWVGASGVPIATALRERAVFGGYKDLTHATLQSLFTLDFASGDHLGVSGHIMLIFGVKNASRLSFVRRGVSFTCVHNNFNARLGIDFRQVGTEDANGNTDGQDFTEFYHAINADTPRILANPIVYGGTNPIITGTTVTYKIRGDHSLAATAFGVWYHLIYSGEVDVTLA